MKKVLQLVALAVVVTLAIHPLMADPTCAHRSSSGDSGTAACCPMAAGTSAHQMVADSMVLECLASADPCCDPDCCRLMAAPTILQMAAPGKFGASRKVSFVPAARLSAVYSPALATWSSGNTIAPASARYILFLAFRI